MVINFHFFGLVFLIYWLSKIVHEEISVNNASWGKSFFLILWVAIVVISIFHFFESSFIEPFLRLQKKISVELVLSLHVQVFRFV